MPETLLFSNNATSTLAATVSDTDTLLSVQPGHGARFPTPAAGEAFHVTLEDDSGNVEICLATQTAGDSITVVRAQEGTLPRTFPAGARVELRATAGVLQKLLQIGGGTLTGDLNLSGFSLRNAALSLISSITTSIINSGIYRAADGNSANQLILPDGGDSPTLGGHRVWTEAVLSPSDFIPRGVILLWSGTIDDVPSGWAFCDGTNGTPNLKGRFVVGANRSFYPPHEISATSQSEWSATTSSDGSHDHGGRTANTALTTNQLPKHTHKLFHNARSDRNSLGSGDAAAVYEDREGEDSYRIYSSNGDADNVNVGESSRTGSGSGHRHDISSHNGHTHTVDSRPPWYALAYIMKITDPPSL